MNKDNINLDDINRITLDLSVPRIVNVRCIQGDSNSRKLVIVLTNDGEFFPVDDSITVEYKLKKPDGKFVDNNVTAIIDGIIYITLSEQAAACTGVVHAELRLSKNLPNESSEDTTSQIISTMPFNIIVEPSVVSNEEIISECESDVINEMITHLKDYNNPHHITKDNIGLGKVENKSSDEIRNEITKSNVTAALGFTPYMPNEVDNKFSALETNIDWKESVPSYKDIASTYPNPQDGWTVNVNDTDYTYRYNGTDWIAISANAIPKATDSVDGLLSKEDHANYNDSNIKKHTHSNKEILDSISSTQISLWNNVNNKVDMIQGKGLSSNDFTTAEKNKLANIPAGIVSGIKGNAEGSFRTGNVNITKDNIGLGNVDNTADANKNVASASRINLPRVTKNVSYQPGMNRFVCEEFTNNSEGLPSTQWYHVLTGQGSDANYNTQLALGMTTNAIYYRNRQGGTWGDWNEIPLLINNKLNKNITIAASYLRVGKPDNAPFGVELVYNNEGGNVSWYSPDGTHWEFDTCGNIFRLFNYTTLKNFVIDKNGNVSIPGYLSVTSNITASGDIKASSTNRIRAGDKVALWTDNEGGNIEITSNTGNTLWQHDALNDIYRIYCHNNLTNTNYFPILLNSNETVSVNGKTILLGNQSCYMRITPKNNNMFHMGSGVNYYENYSLAFTQFSNLLQLKPSSNGGVTLGTSDNKFSSLFAKNIYNSSGLITSSDRNKKKDFSNITQKFADAIIDGLKPTSFKYKNGNSGRTHYGLIAQDVEKLLEELEIDNTDFAPLIKEYPKKEVENEDGSIRLETNYDAEPEYFLRYEGFTGLIIKYIQGLKQENTTLKNKMSQIDEQLELLESKLNMI